MRINEVNGIDNNATTARLGALAEFLSSRADDESASKQISISTFISLANNMGISITPEQLKNLSQKPPLNSIIADVQGDGQDGKIVFQGAANLDQDTVSVDQARKTVDQMAKRASNKR